MTDGEVLLSKAMSSLDAALQERWETDKIAKGTVFVVDIPEQQLRFTGEEITQHVISMLKGYGVKGTYKKTKG